MIPFAWVGAAAAVVGAATQVAGAVGGGSAQSGAISQGQQQANAVLAPYSTTGAAADTRTADLLGLNGQPAADTAMSAFQASPGYQWQLGQGLRGVDAGAASKGLLRSGATLKGETTYAEGLANQDFGNYVSRLNSLSNYGITAAGGIASTDTSAAGQQASIAGNEAKGLTSAVGGLAGNKDVQNGLAGAFGSNGSPSTTTVSNPNVSGGSYQAANSLADTF